MNPIRCARCPKWKLCVGHVVRLLAEATHDEESPETPDSHCPVLSAPCPAPGSASNDGDAAATPSLPTRA